MYVYSDGRIFINCSDCGAGLGLSEDFTASAAYAAGSDVGAGAGGAMDRVSALIQRNSGFCHRGLFRGADDPAVGGSFGLGCLPAREICTKKERIICDALEKYLTTWRSHAIMRRVKEIYLTEEVPDGRIGDGAAV